MVAATRVQGGDGAPVAFWQGERELCVEHREAKPIVVSKTAGSGRRHQERRWKAFRLAVGKSKIR